MSDKETLLKTYDLEATRAIQKELEDLGIPSKIIMLEDEIRAKILACFKKANGGTVQFLSFYDPGSLWRTEDTVPETQALEIAIQGLCLAHEVKIEPSETAEIYEFIRSQTDTLQLRKRSEAEIIGNKFNWIIIKDANKEIKAHAELIDHGEYAEIGALYAPNGESKILWLEFERQRKVLGKKGFAVVQNTNQPAQYFFEKHSAQKTSTPPDWFTQTTNRDTQNRIFYTWE